MNLQDSVAFVTRANRGIGKAYVEALVQAGARRIYAAARSLDSLDDVVAIAPDRIVAIAQGMEEVYPDPVSQSVFVNLKTPLKEAEKQFAGMLP
jgi:NAD(P)-dependent dehydrogenase (short-subunit alcohol dehydrogenase family)